MTEKEAIKLVKKQNRQNRIENIKDFLFEWGIPLLIGVPSAIIIVCFLMFPGFLDVYYGAEDPAWLYPFTAIWISVWIGGPILALAISGIVIAIKEKIKEFRKQVQDELRIARHREELAPKIEQWLIDHGYRNTERYIITDIWLHHVYNIGNCRYKDKEFDYPDHELYLHINLDKEEEKEDE